VSKKFTQYEQEFEDFDFRITSPSILRKFKGRFNDVEQVSKKSKNPKKFKLNREK